MGEVIKDYSAGYNDKESLMEAMRCVYKDMVHLRKNDITRHNNSNQFKLLGEWYNLALYIYALAYHDRLSYPFSFKKDESPDFIINDSLGIELVKATDGEYQAWLKKGEKEQSIRCFDEMGSVGDEPEFKAFKAMMESVSKKNKLFPRYREIHQEVGAVRLLIELQMDSIIDSDYLYEILLNKTIVETDFDEVSVFVTINQDCYIIIMNIQDAPQHEVLTTPYLL